MAAKPGFEPQIPDELRPALAIFIKELDGHLSYLTNLLSQAQVSPVGNEVKPALINPTTLEHRFHVIKGGASFFKLEDIRNSASKGENMFKNGKAPVAEQTQVLADLSEIVESFDRQAQALRAGFLSSLHPAK